MKKNEKYEEFKRESIARFISNLAGYMNLTGKDREIIYDLMKKELDVLEVHCVTGLPKSTFSKNKLVARDNIIMGRFPVDGIWRHLVQVDVEDTVYYYTDGLRADV